MSIDEQIGHLQTYFTRIYGPSNLSIQNGELSINIKINGVLSFTNRIPLVKVKKQENGEIDLTDNFIKTSFSEALQTVKDKYGIV